jgi:hypothetical protein
VAARGDLVRRAGRSGLRPEKGAIGRLYTEAPAGSVVVCLDEMGPQASKSYPGRRLVRPAGPKAERARQEIDYGRRGTAGYVFGALQPATGAAFTLTYERRATVNWVDFLSAVERVHAVLDNLNVHGAPGVPLFGLLHPRWEFVFQPTDAACLDLIEPWWEVLRSLALKGRRFETRGRDRAGGRTGHRLLERPQASLRLGPAAAPSPAPPPRHRRRPQLILI